MATRAWIGISGWRYAPWRGEFYPPGLPSARSSNTRPLGSRPSSSTAAFTLCNGPSTTSVGTTRFHRLPFRRQRVALHHAYEAVAQCRDGARELLRVGLLALEHKLGPLLWQLPPTLKFDERLEPFLEATAADDERSREDLPAGTTRASPAAPIYAPAKIASCATRSRCGTRASRHLSSSSLLREQNVALVVADTAGRWPFLEDLTSDFVYVRLHGDAKLYESGYTDAALERWAERIRAWRDGRKPKSPRSSRHRRRAAPSGATFTSTSTTTSRCTPRTTP